MTEETREEATGAELNEQERKIVEGGPLPEPKERPAEGEAGEKPTELTADEFLKAVDRRMTAVRQMVIEAFGQQQAPGAAQRASQAVMKLDEAFFWITRAVGAVAAFQESVEKQTAGNPGLRIVK